MLIIRTPTLPATVQQATVLRWHRSVNEAIGRNVILVDLQMGNEIVSIRCPRAGIVEKIIATVGKTVVAKSALAIIKDGLPVFDGEAELEITESYALSAEELSVSSQVAVQQLLGEQGAHYANRIQSLPPKWEIQQHAEAGSDVGMDHNVEVHPIFANKASARNEVHPHPSDLSSEQVNDAQLQYGHSHQATPHFSPQPRPR